MKANATVSVRRNAVQNKKARTTGKVCTKKNTGSPLPQASADLPEQQIALDSSEDAVADDEDDVVED